MSAGENLTSDEGRVTSVNGQNPWRDTTSEELKDATTVPDEGVMSGTWGEFAAQINALPLDRREAWFHHSQQAEERSQNCMISDHERVIKFLEGQLRGSEATINRVIEKLSNGISQLAGVDVKDYQRLIDEAMELRKWIENYSSAMPEESWFSHNIDGSEEEEILQFIELTTEWYMTVMHASAEVDYEPTLTYNMRFMFNPEIQEFKRISDEGNIWHTCSVCKGPIRYNDAPTGGWWSHAEHPHDDHDAEISA